MFYIFNFLKNKINRNIVFVWCILLLVNLSVIFYHLNNKDIFHIDEAWSYAHANSTQGAFLHPTMDDHMKLDDGDDFLYNKWVDSKVFNDYLTVQKEEIFSYKHINDNLAKDVHPPLYFFILHTVSSFFTDDINKWFAGGLNIFCFIIILFLTYKLSLLLGLTDKTAFLPVILWGFSLSGIVSVVFLRMYALQTVFLLALTINVFKALKNHKTDYLNLFFIFLFSLLGCYTQYNSIVLSFIMIIALCFILLCCKHYKNITPIILTLILSIVALFIIYPHAFNSLFYSARGNGVFSSILLKIKEFSRFLSLIDFTIARFSYIYFGQIWNLPNSLVNTSLYILVFCVWYYSFINLPPNLRSSNIWRFLFITILSLFCISPMFCFFVILIFMLINAGLQYKTKNCLHDVKKINLFLFLLVMGWGIFISATMPYWGKYDVRYFIPISPLLSVTTISIILQYVKNKKVTYIILTILIIINCCFANFTNRSAYSAKYDNNTASHLKEIKGKKIFILDNRFSFIFFERLYYLINTDKVWFSYNYCNQDFFNEIDSNIGEYVWKIYIPKKLSLFPNEIEEKSCPNLEARLKYKYNILLSERTYSVYEIIDKNNN